MRIVERVRALEVMTGVADGGYSVAYAYDANGRIESETVTGDINRVTSFTYDTEDNISTEVVQENGNTITKTYTYDPVTKNITKIDVVVGTV